MATSSSTLLRTAAIAVLNGDAGIQALCGRSSGCVVSWDVIGAAKLPAIAYEHSSDFELDGIGDPREDLVTFGALADGANGLTVVEALCQRVREALTPMALYTLGVEAIILELTEQRIDDGSENPAGRARRDLTVRLRVEA